MKKLFVLLLIILPFNLAVAEKQTTFDNDIFNKAQSDGKTVVVSSWIKYCTSCASQMKALKNVEKDFNNLVYLNFDVREKEIAKQLNIQFQTTLVIYKNNKIESVVLSSGEKIDADFFVDCSGLTKVLIKHLSDEIVSYDKYLPLNEAIIYDVDTDEDSISPYTTSKTMDSGWKFKIQKAEGTGRGYTYSNSFSDETKSLEELNKFYGKM